MAFIYRYSCVVATKSMRITILRFFVAVLIVVLVLLQSQPRTLSASWNSLLITESWSRLTSSTDLKIMLFQTSEVESRE